MINPQLAIGETFFYEGKRLRVVKWDIYKMGQKEHRCHKTNCFFGGMECSGIQSLGLCPRCSSFRGPANGQVVFKEEPATALCDPDFYGQTD
jgi:hypothetical protein